MMGFDSSKIGKDRIISGVTTIDSDFTSYYSLNEVFALESEKYEKMRSIFIKLVSTYMKVNKKMPRNVIIFATSLSKTDTVLFKEYFTNKAYEDLTKEIKDKINMSCILVSDGSF